MGRRPSGSGTVVHMEGCPAVNESSVRLEVIPVFFTALSGHLPPAQHTVSVQSLPVDAEMAAAFAKS